MVKKNMNGKGKINSNNVEDDILAEAENGGGVALEESEIGELGGEAPTNDAAGGIALAAPYTVEFKIKGVCPILFHRYSVEAVEQKSLAKKGSAEKKTDDVESYVYRDQDNAICLPGEYVRQCLINTGKFRQDPRSPRKSAADLYKAILIPLTELAKIGRARKEDGVEKWDFLDKRRVVVQRNAVPRSRPAFQAEWTATFQFMIQIKNFLSPDSLHDLLVDAGRLTGVGDYRPTYGRFVVTSFEEITN